MLGTMLMHQLTHTGWNERTTEHRGGPSPWIGHLLVLFDQLGVHAWNFSVIYEMEGGCNEFIHCWQLRMATAVSFLHRQLSSSPHA